MVAVSQAFYSRSVLFIINLLFESPVSFSLGLELRRETGKCHCFSNYLDSVNVHPKGNQSWVFIGRSDVKAETLILWPSDGKS